MSRLPSHATLLAAAVALALSAFLAPRVAAEGGETKTFEGQNVKLTLPSKDWEFLDVTADEKTHGYIGRVIRRIADADAGTFVEAYVYVAPTNDLSLLDRAHELMEAAKSDFQATDQTEIGEAKLAGLAGRVVVVRGEAKSGGTGFYLWYAVAAGKTFHHLLVKAYNGAERPVATEIDELRRGYHLLKGGGPAEASPAKPPSYGAEDGEGSKTPGGEWPAKGPKREGRAILFPTWNMKWTLPEGGPWQVASVTPDEVEHKSGLLLRLEAKLPGMKPDKPRDGEPEKPPVDPECIVACFGGPAQSGVTPEQFVKDDGVLQGTAKRMFDNVNIGQRRVVTDAGVGNYKGAAVQLQGLSRERVRFFRLYVVHLKGRHYEWQVIMTGDRYADDVFKGPIKALMDGVEFLDTNEPLRGPLVIEGVGADVVTRGKIGETKDIPFNGFSMKRPKDVAQLDVPAGAGPTGLQVALEARSPDGQKYFYADVSVRSAREIAQNRQTLEDLVNLRRTNWEANAGDTVTITKGKEPFFDASFGVGKGSGYRFTGTLGDIPFVEKGWIVKVKDRIFLIRMQFGGEDAEKVMEKTAKAVEKAIKFDR